LGRGESKWDRGGVVEKKLIDEATQNRIVDKAGEISKAKVAKLDACAPGTFAGICQAFRMEGIDCVGTCGAVSAAAFPISHVVGVTPEELTEDVNRNYAIAIPIVEYVVSRF
jgi:hypothetical protein